MVEQTFQLVMRCRFANLINTLHTNYKESRQSWTGQEGNRSDNNYLQVLNIIHNTSRASMTI